MLVKCPECDLQVSDKAVTCPHCGYPLKPNARQRISTKRKKLPNGFGQISFLKARNLRKPYRAMVTIAKTELGKPVCKILSYHKTYNEAYEALVEYHKDPNKVNSNITLAELFEKWKVDFNGAHNYFLTLKSAWPYCERIAKTQVRDIRVRHIKLCLENSATLRNGEIKTPSDSNRKTIKSLLSSLLAYAIEYDLITHNYADDVVLSKISESKTPTQKRQHKAFTNDDFKLLKTKLDEPIGKMILVQCYTGMRPQEICLIKRDTVDFKDWFIVGGIKTKNGKDRIIPIHSEIKNIIRDFYKTSEGSKYLFPINTYNKYYTQFCNLFPNHMPHDPRKTFVTYAKKYKMDEYAIKRIVGHSITDVTEGTYTERSIDWLHEELQKIKVYV